MMGVSCQLNLDLQIGCLIFFCQVENSTNLKGAGLGFDGSKASVCIYIFFLLLEV